MSHGQNPSSTSAQTELVEQYSNSFKKSMLCMVLKYVPIYVSALYNVLLYYACRFTSLDDTLCVNNSSMLKCLT
jgi:hypothetical protein